MHDDIAELVNEVASSVLGHPVSANNGTSRSTDPTWDSLKHVELLFAVEDACAVQFDKDELAGLDSIESIVAAVHNHRGS